MKKVLLAGTALTGASLIAGSAVAEVSVAALAQVDYTATSIDGDTSTDGLGTDFELYFSGSKEINNGMTASFYVDYNGLSTGETQSVDESFVTLSGGWGQIILGDKDGAGGRFNLNGTAASGGASGSVGGGYYDLDSHTATTNTIVGGTSSITTGLTADGNDQTKITYMTADFGGFQAAASYVGHEGASKSGMSVGASFSQDMGGASVAVNAAWAERNADADEDDQSGYRMGASVAMSGFTVAAGYASNEVDDDINDTNDTSREVSAYNVGVGYSMGDTSFGVHYIVDEASDSDANTDDLEMQQIGLSVSHSLGEGVSVTLGVSDGDYDDTDGTNKDFQRAKLEISTSW